MAEARIGKRCTFCDIVAGLIPAHVVWSDAAHVAFLDTSPITAGHLVLVPRAHAPWIEDLPPEGHARLFERVRALLRPVAAAAGAPHTGIAIEGYGVEHVHVHLVPIWRGGDLDPSRQAPAAEEQLLAAAERLRAAIAAER
jgi:diadenosine tetraphosphate (Ap4A) HIT family hydrolase